MENKEGVIVFTVRKITKFQYVTRNYGIRRDAVVCSIESILWIGWIMNLNGNLLPAEHLNFPQIESHLREYPSLCPPILWKY